MIPLRTIAFGFALLVSPAMGACGGSGHPGDASGVDGAVEEARLRLRGAWKLDSFVPEQPMSGAVNEILSPEMRIVFGEAEVSISGSSNSAALAYTLTDPTGDGATIYLHTDGGIAYEVVGKFSGDVINFRSLTAPWRGTGVLVRP